MIAAERSIQDARAANHVVSVCHALSFAACPIALWVGDLVTAERYVGMQLDNSNRHGLARMSAAARRFQGVLLVHRGDVTNGLRLLRASLDELRDEANISTSLRFQTTMGQIAGALGRAGQVAEGLAAIEKALAVAARIEERWFMFDLLRVKGELLLMQDARCSAAAAEELFRRSLEGARHHGALAWELRAATSLARLLREEGRSAEASAVLQPVYDRFTEGFETADLKTAKALLHALQELRVGVGRAAPRTGPA